MRAEHLYPVAEPTADLTHFKLSVYYDKGGLCYATYKTKPRGYYLSVGPIAVEDRGDGVVCTKFTMFSGTCVVLEETKRLNRKQLEAHFSAAKNQIKYKSGQAWDLMAAKLAEAGATLASEEPAAQSAA